MWRRGNLTLGSPSTWKINCEADFVPTRREILTCHHKTVVLTLEPRDVQFLGVDGHGVSLQAAVAPSTLGKGYSHECKIVLF